MSNKNVKKKKVEQNNPKGAVLGSHKPDLMCGGIHQISVFRPSVIIDSHMHIQSGRCAPLQFVQNVNILMRNKTRLYIEEKGKKMGRYIYGAKAAYSVLEYIFVPEIAVYKSYRAAKYNDGNAPPIKAALTALTEQSAKPTRHIGDDFMLARDKAFDEFLIKEKLYAHLSRIVFSCIVMTMDMEFAHVDGYYGLKIYNPLYKTIADINNLKPCDYWTPVHGHWENIYTGAINQPGQSFFRIEKSRGVEQYVRTNTKANLLYPNMKDKYQDFEKKAAEEMSLYGSYYDIKRKETLEEKIHAVPVLTSKEETDTYEQWEKQLKDTELSMLKYPLKMLPLFHYDPRRYQPDGNVNGNEVPFNQVTGKGLYLGFKIYTAQGYQPWDVRRLPILENFYARCCKDNIPIMNHGTPGGAASFEKKEYYIFVHPNDNDEDRRQKLGKQHYALGATFNDRNIDPVEYFNDQFVSPDAWRKVLDKTVLLTGKNGTKKFRLNKLRLCLAHFGGPTKLGMQWHCKIIEMIRSSKYPNLYTDISSSFASDDFRSYFMAMIQSNKEIEDHILFGTDWYLTLSYGLTFGKSYLQYCRETKRFLDSFNISLWPKFTQYNPYRFYRLDEQINRIAYNIITRRKSKEILKELPELYDDQIKGIKKEAAYIIAPKQSHQIWEETPWYT